MRISAQIATALSEECSEVGVISVMSGAADQQKISGQNERMPACYAPNYKDVLMQAHKSHVSYLLFLTALC
jgi:hypothetical protein